MNFIHIDLFRDRVGLGLDVFLCATLALHFYIFGFFQFKYTHVCAMVLGWQYSLDVQNYHDAFTCLFHFGLKK